jgi:hypothetical protein
MHKAEASARRDPVSRENVVRRGRLREAPISRVLRRLGREEATGCLLVGEARLWLDAGRIVRAFPPSGEDRLGLRLLTGAHILPGELADARRASAAGSTTLAEIVLERGVARRDVVGLLERDLARQILVDALLEPSQEIAFDEDDPGPGPLIEVQAAELLEEARRVVIEIADAIRYVSPGGVPHLSAGLPGPEITLSPEDWAIVSRIDGARSVEELAEQCGFAPTEACLAVFRLAALGLVEVDPDGAAPESWFEGEDEMEGVDAPPVLRDDQPAEGGAPASGGIDTPAMLRELSALARDPDPAR